MNRTLNNCSRIHKDKELNPYLILFTLQTTCSNDISLLYPWLHISDTLLDIKTWLRRQTNRMTASVPTPPPPLLSGSLGRHGKLDTATVDNMRIVQVIVMTAFVLLYRKDMTTF